MGRQSIGFFAALALGILSGTFGADAQQPEKIPHIAFLGNHSPSFPPYEGFRQGLRELGYVEGQNIVVEYRWAEGNLDRLPDLARELAQLKIALLLVVGDHGFRAAKKATDTIPILLLSCDPVDTIVPSLARPGGGVTGLTCVSSEMAGKRVELLKDVIPDLHRIAVLYDPEDTGKAWEVRQTQLAAAALDVTVDSFEVRELGGFDAAFSGIMREQDQAVVVLPDVFFMVHRQRIAELASKNRIPAIYGYSEFVEAGGFISYGAPLVDMYKRSATYVDKILKGVKPGELPIEQAMKFELVINLKAAAALGLTVPHSVLLRANVLIE
jgi:putative tryptophan/tyrosine transport system substrate-binding protein